MPTDYKSDIQMMMVRMAAITQQHASCFTIVSPSIFSEPSEVGGIITPILQMKKSRLKDVN